MTAIMQGAPFQKPLRLLLRFIRLESFSGLLLFLCAVAALIWANSGWASGYNALWKTEMTISVGNSGLTKPLIKWINDGLMALFFFLVGLEIKREVLVGALASPKRALLPIAAAIGGMLVPALMYLTLNLGTPEVRGWAIPMATDIAFALGVLTLLGSRVSDGLKAFLLALAIADDIGAVLVIAFFYTGTLAWSYLGYAAICLLALIGVNRTGVRHPLVYVGLGVITWFLVLSSGVHATVAGVLVAMTIPARRRIDIGEFLRRSRATLEEVEKAHSDQPHAGGHALSKQQVSIQSLQEYCQAAESPLLRLEQALHPWVAFGVMPLFALANAGVALDSDVLSELLHPVSLGIALGLVLGKPFGVVIFSWLVVSFRLADLPNQTHWRQIVGVGFLAGIGFTMSLFITDLAFESAVRINLAKIGILGASLIAGVLGWGLLRASTSRSC